MTVSRGRTLVEVVPRHAQPGVTKMTFALSETQQLSVVVPTDTQPGDQLKLTETESGEWKVSVLRRIAPDDSGTRGTKKKITCLVPPEVCPGEKIAIGTGDGGKILAVVPANAKPADSLVFEQEGDHWRCTLLKNKPRERNTQGLQDLSNLAPPRAQPLDDDVAFDRLCAAVRNAGGTVSSKIRRGAVAPLFIPGVVATERIEVGEELCRIPRRLHISPNIVENVVPKLAAAISCCKDLPPGRRKDALHTAFVAQMFLDADARAVARGSSAGPPEEGYMPEISNHIDPDVKQVWDAMGDNLLSQDFAYHPFRRAAADPETIRKQMLPSPEVDYFIDSASDIIAIHGLLVADVPKELLGPRFEEVSMFLRAKLSTLTRVFQTCDQCTLVPIADFFNHQSGNPGASWIWEPELDAMVVVSNRAYAPGEEICDSYGFRSNVLLYRTYGFTQTPSVEPSWNYAIKQDTVVSIYEVFLPEDYRCQHLPLMLDGKEMDESLIGALNAAGRNKQNGAEMLRLICVRSRAAYDEDLGLRPALEALTRARDVDATCHNWWEYLHAESEGLQDDDGVRIKMSEVLCLTAHLEALEVYRGTREESRCMALSRLLTKNLVAALGVLRVHGEFKVVKVKKSDKSDSE
mmetsp:Transcript_7436/g.11928  ORF Transcript_7436/g.11928 Transcript_7436/m.11928 type:complete len:634 (+) Transcript_7436:60-1961(+)